MTGFAARSLLELCTKGRDPPNGTLIRIIPDAAGILLVLMRLTKINA